MKIDKPTENQKNMAIEEILQKGLVRPATLTTKLWEMWRTLGPKYIFGDIYQALIIAVVVIVGFFSLYLQFLCLQSSRPIMHSITFAFAPLSFLIIMLFAEIIERLGGLYELKMTFKYTIRQITAFRILCFSLLGVVFCVISSVFSGGGFFQAFATSLCALFLCSFLIAFIVRRFAPLWRYVSMGAWVLASILFIYIFGNKWEMLLSNTPTALTFILAAVVFALFLHEIKQIITEKRGVEIYAGC